jgi:hypothetical protein
MGRVWCALAKVPDKSSNPIGVCTFGMRRYGVDFLGPTKNDQATDEYRLCTFPDFLYGLFDGLFTII